jgi:hypothetical protein
MTPKQFILENSDKFREAVENGYDIRMEESEIFEWMERYSQANKYYYLKEGEIVQEGDEVEISANWNDPPKWVPAVRSVGSPAPDPSFPAHRKFRRLIFETKIHPKDLNYKYCTINCQENGAFLAQVEYSESGQYWSPSRVLVDGQWVSISKFDNLPFVRGYSCTDYRHFP